MRTFSNSGVGRQVHEMHKSDRPRGASSDIAGGPGHLVGRGPNHHALNINQLTHHAILIAGFRKNLLAAGGGISRAMPPLRARQALKGAETARAALRKRHPAFGLAHNHVFIRRFRTRP